MTAEGGIGSRRRDTSQQSRQNTVGMVEVAREPTHFMSKPVTVLAINYVTADGCLTSDGTKPLIASARSNSA